MNKYLILIVLMFFNISLDQVTKNAVVQRFQLHESLPVILGFFNLTYVQNKGAAFGFLSQADPAFRVPFFIIVPVLALFAIFYIFQKIPNHHWGTAVALSMIISGAIGNLVDRMMLGYVVDFLDFHWDDRYHFPAFNVADSVICIGVGIIIIDLILHDEELAEKEF